MEIEELIVYGVCATVGFIAGWAAKRYAHETESDVAQARRSGFDNGKEAGKHIGVELCAESIADLCEERNIAHTGDDPRTGKPRPYTIGEIIEETRDRLYEDN